MVYIKKCIYGIYTILKGNTYTVRFVCTAYSMQAVVWFAEFASHTVCVSVSVCCVHFVNVCIIELFGSKAKANSNSENEFSFGS